MISKDILTVKPDASLHELAKLLYQQRISGVPVVDDQGFCVGVVSEKDFFRRLYPSYQDYQDHPETFLSFETLENNLSNLDGLMVEDIMSPDPIMVFPETPVMKAGAIMLARHHHRLPVVDQETNKFLGMVSRGDLYRAVLQKYLEN